MAISVIPETLSPTYRMVSEKFTFIKTRNFATLILTFLFPSNFAVFGG